MESRALGPTGLAASRIGLGLAALGRPGYVNLGHARDLAGATAPAALERRTHEVLDTAFAADVRYFDAARSYGRAEAFLASWLRDRRLRDGEVTVGSKWGYVYTAGWRTDADVHEVKEHTLEVLLRQTAESRDLLGGHLGLYQIHSATPESGVLGRRDVLEELGRLRDGGLAIGVTTSGPRQAGTIRSALDVRVDGVPLFSAVQSTWNVLETSAGEALAEAHAAGLGVIVKEGLANGRLAVRADAPGAGVECAALLRTAERLGTTPDALALAAILEQPWADVVLSGAATVGHLRSNLGAVRVTLDDEARHVLGNLRETPEAYWALRSRLPWN